MPKGPSEKYIQYFDQVAASWQNGTPIKDIAAFYGLSKRTVRVWLEKAGLKHKRFTKWPDETRQQAIDLYSQGYSSINVAKMMGIKPSVISNWLRNAGFSPAADRRQRDAEARVLYPNPKPPDETGPAPRHKRGKRWTDSQKREVYRLILEGLEPGEIYHKTGASRRRQSMIKSELE